MSYAWQINQDDTHVVKMVCWNGTTMNKTIGEMKQLVANLGFNCAILTKTNYYSDTNAYMVMTNFGNVSSDLYLGSHDYLSGIDDETIGYSFPNLNAFTQYQRYVLTNDGAGLAQRTGSSFNSFATSVTVGGVTYHRINHQEKMSTIPPIYITTYTGNIYVDGELPSTSVTAPGGGATHIAKVTGHLSALSSNLSDILIVAGGGGGGMIIDSVAYDGADAGGISGSGTNSANQTTGYAFGQGESGEGVSGGGGGLYGGYKGSSGPSPSPVPPEYESYIDIINGSGFWWKDYPNKNYYNASQQGMISEAYPPSTISWISNYDDYSYNFTPTASRQQYCTVCAIQNVYITSNNDVYSVSHTISGSQQAFLYDNNPGWLGNIFTNQTFATMYIGSNPDGTTLSTSGTLAQVLSWMSYRFRNVNIYVDNVCWSKVN